MAYKVITEFLFSESMSPEEFLKLGASSFKEAGLSPTTENSDEYKYMTMDDASFKETTLEGALEKIIESRGGTLEIRFHELKISISYFSTIEAGEINVQLTADVWASQFKLWDDCTKAGVRRRTEQYVTFIRLLSETFDPIYACGGIERPEDLEELLPPIDQINRGEITRLFWLNVFSPTAVDRLGRERILSAPAWDVEELENGRVMLVVSDNPIHPSESWQFAGKRVGEHLNLKW